MRNINYDVIHIKDLKKESAGDDEILEIAYKEERTIISADTDFGYLLQRLHRKKPSFILLRYISTKPQIQFSYLSSVIKKFVNELEMFKLLPSFLSRISSFS